MRIWMHQVMEVIAVFAGFIVGGFLSALLLEVIRDGPRWLVIATMIVAFPALIYGGLRAGEWLVRQLPARCPKCRGPAYAEGHRPIRYRCRLCEYEHFTRSRTNWGAG